MFLCGALVSGARAQAGWKGVPTPPEILEENKSTGEMTIFEEHTNGSKRFTRVTFFPGTDVPRKQRVVTTSNGKTSILSTNYNEYGEQFASTEEFIVGMISYAESEKDLNWQDKRFQGSRWRFPLGDDGKIAGEKVEEDYDSTTNGWVKRPTIKPAVAKQPNPTPTGGTGLPPKPNALGDQNNGLETKPEAVAEPSGTEGKNKIVDSLERNYANAKKQVDRPDYDDNEAVRLLKEMESIAAFAEARIAKEKADDDSTGVRRQKLQNVKDRAEADVRMLKDRLKKSKSAASTSLAGKWRLLVNGQPESGEFTFVEFKETGLAELRKDSKLWVTIVAPDLSNRIVSLVKKSDAPFSIMQNFELRGEAASGRLEFWATPDHSTPEYQKTKYALVREGN